MNPGLPGYNLPGFRMLGQKPDSPATLLPAPFAEAPYFIFSYI